MERDGGGWTLLLNNAGGGGFEAENLLRRYPTQPSLTADYSILGVSDIMLEASGHRQWRYMVEVEVDGDDDTLEAAATRPLAASCDFSASTSASRRSISSAWSLTRLSRFSR